MSHFGFVVGNYNVPRLGSDKGTITSGFGNVQRHHTVECRQRYRNGSIGFIVRYRNVPLLGSNQDTTVSLYH